MTNICNQPCIFPGSRSDVQHSRGVMIFTTLFQPVLFFRYFIGEPSRVNAGLKYFSYIFTTYLFSMNFWDRLVEDTYCGKKSITPPIIGYLAWHLRQHIFSMSWSVASCSFSLKQAGHRKIINDFSIKPISGLAWFIILAFYQVLIDTPVHRLHTGMKLHLRRSD